MQWARGFLYTSLSELQLLPESGLTENEVVLRLRSYNSGMANWALVLPSACHPSSADAICKYMRAVMYLLYKRSTEPFAPACLCIPLHSWRGSTGLQRAA